MNWILSINYFLHLLATVVLLGSLAGVVGLAFPALSQGTIDHNQWLSIQKKLIPWSNSALIVLLLTGFYQMTSDPNYNGFFVLNGVWAWAMLLKHIAYAGMIGISFILQFSLYPEIDRVALLMSQSAESGEAERAVLLARENRLLRLNLGCSILVLLFTAVMTAV